MKIIGATDDGFIISATKDEIANLVGFYSKYENNSIIKNMRIGDNILISEMYRRLYEIERLAPEMVKIITQIEAAAQLLKPGIEVIEKINKAEAIGDHP